MFGKFDVSIALYPFILLISNHKLRNMMQSIRFGCKKYRGWIPSTVLRTEPNICFRSVPDITSRGTIRMLANSNPSDRVFRIFNRTLTNTTFLNSGIMKRLGTDKHSVRMFSTSSTGPGVGETPDSAPRQTPGPGSALGSTPISGPTLDPISNKSSYYESYKKTINDTYQSYTSDYQNLKTDILFIADQFEKKRYNTTKIKILAVCVGGLVLFLFWRTIKSYISHETSDVAIRTMNDEEFKKNMYQLLDQIIDYSKTDPNAQKKIIELLQTSLKSALDDKEVMNQLNKIVSEVVLSEQTKKDIEKLTKDIIHTQLADKENRELLTQTLHQSTTEVYNKVTQDIGNKFKFWK